MEKTKRKTIYPEKKNKKKCRFPCCQYYNKHAVCIRRFLRRALVPPVRFVPARRERHYSTKLCASGGRNTHTLGTTLVMFNPK